MNVPFFTHHLQHLGTTFFFEQQVVGDPDVTTSHLIRVEIPAIPLEVLNRRADVLVVTDLHTLIFSQLSPPPHIYSFSLFVNIANRMNSNSTNHMPQIESPINSPFSFPPLLDSRIMDSLIKCSQEELGNPNIS